MTMPKVENQTQNSNTIDFLATSLTEMDPSGVVEYYSKDGTLVTRAIVKDVLEFIEKNRLNINTEYAGNTGNGEPWNDMEHDVIVDEIVYFDSNFEMVTQLYYVDVLVPVEDPAIEIINKKLADLDKEDSIAIKDGNVEKSLILSSIKCALMDVKSDLSKALLRRAA